MKIRGEEKEKKQGEQETTEKYYGRRKAVIRKGGMEWVNYSIMRIGIWKKAVGRIWQ
jgi:hypothetical protein